MSVANAGTKRRWVWAASGAAVIAGGFAVLLGLSGSPSPAYRSVTPRPRPAIGLAERREKSALDDEATLLDPTPLFQPTRWNTAQQAVMPPDPGGTFQSYRVPAKLGFAETDLQLWTSPSRDVGTSLTLPAKTWASLDLPEPVAVPARPAEALGSGLPGAMSIGFGRVDGSVVMLPERGSLVDIVAIGTGRAGLPPQAMAAVRALAAAARPPENRTWQAMEFLAAVDTAGLAAPLTITTRSGVEEIDSYFQDFLVRTLRIGERLAPGFYRISVGP